MKRFTRAVVCAALFVSILAGPLAIGQTTAEKLAETLDAPITIKFEHTHVQEIFGFISKIYGIDIVVDNRVVAPSNLDKADWPAGIATDGIVDFIDMKSVPLRETLKAMLHPLGLDFVTKEDYVWISTLENTKDESATPLDVRIYLVSDNQATVATDLGEPELVTLLRKIVPPVIEPSSGEMLSYMRYNLQTKQLVVRNTPENLRNVEKLFDLMKRESQPGPQ